MKSELCITYVLYLSILLNISHPQPIYPKSSQNNRKHNNGIHSTLQPPVTARNIQRKEYLVGEFVIQDLLGELMLYAIW